MPTAGEAAVLEMVAEEYSHPVVFHWYSGSLKSLSTAIERGHFFSINPSMLWSEKGRAVIEQIPQERTLTESDGPFVTVATKTVVPADIQLVEQGLAKIWRMSASAVRSVIADNFRRLTNPLAEPRNN